MLAGVLSLRGLEQQQVVRSFAHPGAVRFGRIVGLCCCRQSLFPRVPECYALSLPLRGDDMFGYPGSGGVCCTDLGGHLHFWMLVVLQ